MNNLPVLSLQRRGAQLANANRQREILQNTTSLPQFEDVVANHQDDQLRVDAVEVLQVNVGKLCNMTCRHCHVDAGPDRREIMTRETIDDCLQVIRSEKIRLLDLTGGAPEMNPDFKYFVRQARSLDCQVIDRCNLTILLANGFQDMPQFLADNQVQIVASLPCYVKENADSQRGDGSFEKSIQALRLLNRLGYGQSGSGLQLTLVYNSLGPALPPSQSQLEACYREHLSREFDIQFNHLYTITNMPISRFLDELIETGQYESYMQLLVDSFNPLAAKGIMCRQMISVGWDGRLYDCDFNQMLELPLQKGNPQHVREFDRALLSCRQIQTGRHCFGCTASAGSGCRGAIDL